MIKGKTILTSENETSKTQADKNNFKHKTMFALIVHIATMDPRPHIGVLTSW